jgi:predicted DNA binding protein
MASANPSATAMADGTTHDVIASVTHDVIVSAASNDSDTIGTSKIQSNSKHSLQFGCLFSTHRASCERRFAFAARSCTRILERQEKWE